LELPGLDHGVGVPFAQLLDEGQKRERFHCFGASGIHEVAVTSRYEARRPVGADEWERERRHNSGPDRQEEVSEIIRLDDVGPTRLLSGIAGREARPISDAL